MQPNTYLSKIFSRVEINGECAEWNVPLSRDGYAKLGGKLVHREVYKETRGMITDGFHVDHICFNRKCINPNHLRAIPAIENLHLQRSSLLTHCKHGHEFNDKNTAIRANGYKSRQCLKCAAFYSAKYRSKKKAIAA
jgi:hypothetical protein